MKPDRTDWDAYYDEPYFFARFTRQLTGSALVGYMRRHGGAGPLRVAELGGANSCFYEPVRDALRPAEYHVLDNNERGLEALRRRFGADRGLVVRRADVLALSEPLDVDVAFSVGMVEHFAPEETRAAIDAHFRVLRPGGIAIISYPTPTFLYSATRRCSEALGMWIFHDERPLRMEEVRPTLERHGEVLDATVIWPMFLTQQMVVARKRAASRR